MLTKALQNTSDAITEQLTWKIWDVGCCTSALEQRVEELHIITGNHVEELETLRKENLTLQSHLEDFENRAKRSNLCIQGIPETVVDLQFTITALFQELAPSIPMERQEMDRIHRALTPRPEDGPLREVVVKRHYFCTKEQLMAASRNKESLTFQGHRYQIFLDLFQLTLNKRKAMKLHLLILQQHHIIYCWSFAFAVRASHNGSSYLCKFAEDLQATLVDLHLSPPEASAEGSRRTAESSSPKKLQASPGRHAQSSVHKRGCFASPAPAPEDSMD